MHQEPPEPPLVTRALLWCTARQRRPLHHVVRWSTAVVAPLVAGLIQSWIPLDPFPSRGLLLHLSVALVALFAGTEPVLLTLVTSALLGNLLYFSTGQVISLTPSALAGTASFLLVSAIVALVCATLRNALLLAYEVETALRASEDRLRIAKDLAGLAVGDFDVKTGELTVDGRYREIWGIGPDELATYDELRSAIHEGDRAVMEGKLRQAFDPAGPGDYLAQFRVTNRIDRSERWVESAGRVTFARGSPTRTIGVVREITEQKNAERQLRESEAKYRLLFENMCEGVVCTRVLFDEQGQNVDLLLLEVNRAVEELTGLRDIVGKKATEVFPEIRQEFPELPRIFSRVAATGHPERLELEFPPHEKWYALSFFRTEEPCVVVVFSDITDRKQADEALREADRRKSEFLGVLSHELRNPLTPIRNSAHVLASAPPGGELSRRAIAIIDRQSRHLTRLIDDLLDVTRIARGKVRLQTERLDLADLVCRSIEDHEAIFEEAGIGLASDVPKDPVFVLGDPVRLSQILGNLLSNAVKFTARGGRVKVSLESEPDGQATLTVRDTGAGISEETLPQIFEPFVQSDRTLARSSGGLGLGLSLVKGFAEMHGGTVDAWSEGVGKGTVFTVRIPVQRALAPRMAPAALGSA